MARFDDDMPAPAPLDEMAAGPQNMPDQDDASGAPPEYRSEDQTCENCEYFREFQDPSCSKFSYAATPGGSCKAFESRKEDSDGTKEESYGSIEGDEDMEGDE